MIQGGINWMKAIPSITELDDLSIPGTHDSCARHGCPIKDFGRCQNLKLKEQFERGISFIDTCTRKAP